MSETREIQTPAIAAPGSTRGGVRTFRRGLYVAQVVADVADDTVWAVLNAEGESLKESRKTIVRRVDNWVIKRSRASFPAGWARHTFRRERYRRGWNAARYLQSRGVLVPKPVAYIERRLAGFIAGNAFICEYLDGWRNVEQCLRALVHGGAGPDPIHTLLERLADAVNALIVTGAYHDDLSGKNVFTRDARSFCFIDLDAVELNVEYTDERRRRNLVQLYDSFCDEISDVFLAPFIARMLESRHDPRVWLPTIRHGQAERRREFNARRVRTTG